MTVKIEPYTKEWEELANRLARDFAPRIYPCKKCGFPVAHGFSCTFCGDSNPQFTKEEE